MQCCSISSALAMEILQYFTAPSKCTVVVILMYQFQVMPIADRVWAVVVVDIWNVIYSLSETYACGFQCVHEICPWFPSASFVRLFLFVFVNYVTIFVIINPLRPSDTFIRQQPRPSLVQNKRQAIIWTDAVLLSSGPLGTTFSQIVFHSRKWIRKLCLQNLRSFVSASVC